MDSSRKGHTSSPVVNKVYNWKRHVGFGPERPRGSRQLPAAASAGTPGPCGDVYESALSGSCDSGRRVCMFKGIGGGWLCGLLS